MSESSYDDDLMDFEEYALIQQHFIQQQQAIDEERLTGIMAAIMFVLYASEEAKRIRAARRAQHRHYLTRSDLLPNRRAQTPWQILYENKRDRAFVTTWSRAGRKSYMADI